MQKTSLKFIWNYLKRFKAVLLMIAIFAIIARSLSQGGAYYMAKIFDFSASNTPSSAYWKQLGFLLVLFIALEAFSHTFQTLSMWFASRLVPHIRSIVIKDVFEHVNKHSISYFTNEMTGNISNKFNQLQNGMVEFFMQSGSVLFDSCYLLVPCSKPIYGED